MPWPVPAPGDISGRAAAVYEAEFARIFALRNPSAAPAIVDARSPNSTLAVHARVGELLVWDLYLYQARLAYELMPDTAQDWLSRHALIWGVPQVQPVAAIGNAVVAAAPGAVPVVIPAGEVLTAPGGALYTLTVAVSVPAGGTAPLPIAANVAGVAGDLPMGTVLSFVNGIAGINPQTATVDANGITGGQDLESLDSWRARILARIRQRGGGGTAADYEQWVGEILPAAIVSPLQLSLGAVNVVIAVSQGAGLTPRVPTTAELATVTAYLNDTNLRKPLGMSVLVSAATLVAVPVSIHLNPDTVAIRAAATTALQLFFLSDGAIGGTIDVSRLDAALSNASGEFSHDRTLPAADVTYLPTQLPILGAITFT